MNNKLFLPPEWYRQSAVQLTWPHEDTDWQSMLPEVTECYVRIATEILKRQKLLIICRDAKVVTKLLAGSTLFFANLILAEIPTNDTWARDHAFISVFGDSGKKMLYDFTFNGWGLKFASDKDNCINRLLFEKHNFDSQTTYCNYKNFVLEGGSIEVDGKGTLLTTSECLLSPNRNSYWDKTEIENYLKTIFGLDRVLWLDHGYLNGDDTDSHIDTLARFCDEHTIAYVKCDDRDDEHYEALNRMEKQLKGFKDYKGQAYELVPLPMAKAVYDEDGQRLPATYANFLIMNGAVLLPSYGDSIRDEKAKQALSGAFPDREIVLIDCSPLIRQHGSLHCITMQYPEGIF